MLRWEQTKGTAKEQGHGRKSYKVFSLNHLCQFEEDYWKISFNKSWGRKNPAIFSPKSAELCQEHKMTRYYVAQRACSQSASREHPQPILWTAKAQSKKIYSSFSLAGILNLGWGAFRIDCPKPKRAFTKGILGISTSVNNSCQSFCSCLTQTALVWVGEVVPCRARRWQVGSIFARAYFGQLCFILRMCDCEAGKKKKFTHKKSARLQVECSHILNVMFFQTSPSLQSPPATAGPRLVWCLKSEIARYPLASIHRQASLPLPNSPAPKPHPAWTFRRIQLRLFGLCPPIPSWICSALQLHSNSGGVWMPASHSTCSRLHCTSGVAIHVFVPHSANRFPQRLHATAWRPQLVHIWRRRGQGSSTSPHAHRVSCQRRCQEPIASELPRRTRFEKGFLQQLARRLPC